MSMRARYACKTSALALLTTSLFALTTLAAPALAQTAAPTKPKAAAPKNVDYAFPGGNPAGERYSPLTQINAKNVDKLQQAWVYDFGAPAAIENQPIVVKGVLYGVGPKGVYALDGATGAVKWEHALPTVQARNPRSLSYWADGKDHRLLISRGATILALNADSGETITSFGQNGEVSMNENLRGPASANDVKMTSAVSVYKNVFVTSGGVGERTPASPGDIRGWDVITGKLLWTFHTIPHPGEVGADTWPANASEVLGGANDWAGFAMDDKKGVVYAVTGSPSDDFGGVERLGDNRFSDSVIAIDATTGKRLWDFQAVHHDLWDADFDCPPTLTTITHNGKPLDVVVATNKTSWVWILDRKTGKPVFGAKEMPVPGSDVPGEVASKTQPIPNAPEALSRVAYTEADVTNRTPEAHADALEKFRAIRNGPEFTPAGYKKETFVAPGFTGGEEWGGIAVDPKAHVAFFNTHNAPSYTAVTDNPPKVPGQVSKFDSRYNFSGYHGFTDKDGYPGVTPPWGNLTAVNLDTGKFLWRIPFGEYPELVAKGIKDTGSANTGGAVVTASGLLIIAATQQDHKFHAYDTKTGKLLWETVLPAAGTATPITYMVNGRQYVGFATCAARRGGARPPAGAAPGQGAPPAQADDAPSAAATDATTSQLIVFALPKS